MNECPHCGSNIQWSTPANKLWPTYTTFECGTNVLADGTEFVTRTCLKRQLELVTRYAGYLQQLILKGEGHLMIDINEFRTELKQKAKAKP